MLRVLSYINFVFNFTTKYTGTIEYLYCLLSTCYMFRRLLCHPEEELLSLLKIL
jgi:hypothetical protein